MSHIERSMAFLPLTIVSLAIGGCAVGFGEEATGLVELSMVPGGTVSGGVRFDQATLTLLALGLVPGEEDEAGGGHDHGHNHLEQASSTLPSAHLDPLAPDTPLTDELGELRFPIGSAFPVEVDLLGPEQHVMTLEVAVASYEGLTLQAAGHSGCGLYASGIARLDEGDVPVSICLPVVNLEVAIHFDLGLDDRLPLRLMFSVHGLLSGVDVSRLGRADDGSIRIDDHSNPFAALQVEKNLNLAFTTL